jgi:chemotaxis protein histidine kinase CheA
MDRIKEQMDQLAELGDDQVAELQSAILKQFETVEKEDPTPQTVDAMTSLADMLDGVRNEVKRREAAAQELAQRASEAATRVYGQDGEKEEENMEAKTEEAPMAEEAPVAPVTEEAPAEEAPVSETPAPMEEEKKMEEAAMHSPEKETPSDKEEEEKEKEEKTMTEASIEAGKNTEFSTESQTETIETSAPVAVVEEPVVAAAEESVAPVATEEAPTAEVASAEAPVAEAVAETVVDAPVATEASVETVEGAEASIQETSTQASEPTLVQENMEAPVTAAANADNLNIEVPADRRPTSRTSAAPVAITAGADIPGYTAGSPLTDMNAVAEAMSKRLHGLRRVNGGDGEQHIVASVTTSFPEDRTLTQDAESNWAKINAVTSPEALVASGGHAAPFETKYDIFGIGTTARPVRDALPRFQADRGGIRFVTPPVLSSYGNAVGVWTNAVDTSPGTDVKASLTVSAAAEQTVATDAVTLQLQFGNLMTRAYPELIARHNELGLIQHAREAEQNLLSKIASASSAVTTTSLIGFGRDFLVQLGRAASAYRSRHRLEVDAPLRAIIPGWVKDAMAADLALSMPGDNTLNAYAEIDGYVASRGVTLSVSLDQNVSGSQSASAALNEFADSFTWYLFAEGSFLFLDGGTLDLGIIRDSTLVGTNDYKMFVETFEGVAFIGVEALVITSTISINGVAAALRDTTGGATAAAIEY